MSLAEVNIKEGESTIELLPNFATTLLFHFLFLAKGKMISSIVILVSILALAVSYPYSQQYGNYDQQYSAQSQYYPSSDQRGYQNGYYGMQGDMGGYQGGMQYQDYQGNQFQGGYQGYGLFFMARKISYKTHSSTLFIKEIHSSILGID